MKTLVAYFSKTGTTKKLGQKIAQKIGADIDEIIDVNGDSDKKMRSREPVEIKYQKDPAEYDLAIVGGPVWAFSATPVLKTYLKKNKFNKVAFFCTYGLWKGFIFSQMKKLSGEPAATLSVKMKNIEKSEEEINEFCQKLK